MISFDQPWGEYLHRSRLELAPLTLADALVRSELGLGGIAVECNVGYSPGGTAPRDLLAFNRLVDWWGSFGLPLYFYIAFPSAATVDPLCRKPAHVAVEAHPRGASPAGQLAWVEQFVSLLVAKPAVRGVFWNQLSDAEPHDFPHGGLIDATGDSKPALEATRPRSAAHAPGLDDSTRRRVRIQTTRPECRQGIVSSTPAGRLFGSGICWRFAS